MHPPGGARLPRDRRDGRAFVETPILGVPVAQVTYETLLGWIEAVQGSQSSLGEGARSVVFANVHVLTEAVLSPAYREALLDAEVVAPDGMPLRWASQLLGRTLPDRCYGPELLLRALDHGQDLGIGHYFYGAVASTLTRLEQAIRAQFPRARLAGFREAPFGPLDDRVETAHIEAINASGADILWVGMGCPKQELWMARYRRRLAARVVLGVGAGFDFVAGVKPQAPALMQRRGLEWLFRLGTEPRRLWRRYLIRNPMFLLLFSVQLLSRSLQKPGAADGEGP